MNGAGDLARAVVPPPRLRAFPLVFDAPDADRQRPSCGALRVISVAAVVTQIDAGAE